MPIGQNQCNVAMQVTQSDDQKNQCKLCQFVAQFASISLFDMPNFNWYNILSILIFCKTPLPISISILIFVRKFILISISIFSWMSILYINVNINSAIFKNDHINIDIVMSKISLSLFLSISIFWKNLINICLCSLVLWLETHFCSPWP